MKKYLVPSICLLLIIYVAIRFNSLVTFATNFFTNKQDPIILTGNEYTKSDDYLYVQNTRSTNIDIGGVNGNKFSITIQYTKTTD